MIVTDSHKAPFLEQLSDKIEGHPYIAVRTGGKYNLNYLMVMAQTSQEPGTGHSKSSHASAIGVIKLLSPQQQLLISKSYSLPLLLIMPVRQG